MDLTEELKKIRNLAVTGSLFVDTVRGNITSWKSCSTRSIVSLQKKEGSGIIDIFFSSASRTEMSMKQQIPMAGWDEWSFNRRIGVLHVADLFYTSLPYNGSFT